MQVTSEDFLDFDSELEDLQKLDPQRKAVDLAATAEDFTTTSKGSWIPRRTMWTSSRIWNDSLTDFSRSVTMGTIQTTMTKTTTLIRRSRIGRKLCGRGRIALLLGNGHPFYTC